MPSDRSSSLDAHTDLEARVTRVGNDLSSSIQDCLAVLEGAPHQPQRLADQLSQTIVMTSRLLRAVRHNDPVAVVHNIPGPQPLRRLLTSMRKKGVEPARVAAAEGAVDRFEELIQQEAGDRSSLGAMLSAWLPEQREEFELRRKQTAFKAMSELRGASCAVNFSTILLHPTETPNIVDVVNAQGMLGLHRMRPDSVARFGTRRMSAEPDERHPTNLDGAAAEGLDSVRLDQFCARQPAPLEARHAGGTVHYLLGGTSFGPKSSSDVVLAEVNRREPLGTVPRNRPYFFHMVETASKKVIFDLIVHRDLYEGQDPELILYDTLGGGPASVNDPSRDIDRLQTTDQVLTLGYGLRAIRTSDIPNYVDLMRHVFDKLGWLSDEFRAYRFKSDYAVLGTQACLAFDPTG